MRTCGGCTLLLPTSCWREPRLNVEGMMMLDPKHRVVWSRQLFALNKGVHVRTCCIELAADTCMVQAPAGPSVTHSLFHAIRSVPGP